MLSSIILLSLVMQVESVEDLLTPKEENQCCLRAGVDFKSNLSWASIRRDYPGMPSPDVRLPDWKPRDYLPDTYECGNFSHDYCRAYKEVYPDRDCLLGLFSTHAIVVIVMVDEFGNPWMCAKEPQLKDTDAPFCIRLPRDHGTYPRYIMPDIFRKAVCKQFKRPADCEFTLTPSELPLEGTQPMKHCGIDNLESCSPIDVHKERSCWVESRVDGYQTGSQTCVCHAWPIFCRWETIGAD